ncbi:MAG: FHA domain-containing protein [Chloroflexi bacterium]|nr:FHA domain-containing protein [Chloroflexota bacterium]
MKLVIQAGRDVGREFALEKPVITLGRGRDNNVVLADDLVSRRHAQIQQRGQELILVDLGSKNGTFVNDRRLQAPHTLQPGDRISLGQTTLVVETGVAAAVAAAPPRAKAMPVALPVAAALGGGLILVLLLAILFAARPGILPSPAAATPTSMPGTPMAPTATLARTRAPTPVGTPTGPSTPGPRADCPPWKYCAPSLVGHGPGNGDVFTDQHPYVEMSWESAGTLAPEECYEVWVSFQEGGKPVTVTNQTQGLSWHFPQEYFRRADAPERRYEWKVIVRSQPGNQQLSPPTETRYFFWRESGPLPTPTATMEVWPTSTPTQLRPTSTPPPPTPTKPK